MLLRRFFGGITNLSLRFKWVTIALTIVFCVAGVYSYTRLSQELIPNIEFPQAIVVVVRPGASADDLLNLVTKPLENEAVKIKGVLKDGLESTTSDSFAYVTVRYEYGVNLAETQRQIKAAIDRVADSGIPYDLKTTADLTPKIVTDVLKIAPSMWKHFESRHYLAMSPEILNAVLAMDPDGKLGFAAAIDPITQDQLAARRISVALTATPTEVKPEELPSAWRVTRPSKEISTKRPDMNNAQPQIIAFSLGDIPVVTASVSSPTPITDEAGLKTYKDLLDKQLTEAIRKLGGVADVRVTGGQWIPDEVAKAADEAVKLAASGANSDPQPTPTKSGDNSGGGNGGGTPAKTDPADTKLPASWRNQLPIIGVPAALAGKAKINVNFGTWGDLLKATDADGKPVAPSALLNAIADITDPLPLANKLLPDLNQDALAFLRAAEPKLTDNLSNKALGMLSLSIFKEGAWRQLYDQSGFKAKVATLDDLGKLSKDGKAATTINGIIKEVSSDSSSFGTHLADALTPEALAYLERIQPGFLAALDDSVLKLMSANSLKSLPASLIDSKDATLKVALQAIIADPTKSAASQLTGGQPAQQAGDPTAPVLPASWINALASASVTATNAYDLMKNPFNLSAAAFINAFADRAPNLMKDLPADVYAYLAGKDPAFYTTLSDKTIASIPKDVLDKLPTDVQARASGFVPTAAVTRADGKSSLTLSVYKESVANTVNIAHAVDDVFHQFEKDHPGYQVTPVFEQAPFIEESIQGVGREGALGAVGAVIVILFFLNFSFRSTLVTAVSIPTSVAIALVLMYFIPDTVHTFLLNIAPAPGSTFESLYNLVLRLFPASITLNIMTLSGLTVAIGRVVDDSIVVLENIYRQLQRGITPHEAALHGAKDVSVAIFAATLTTVVVFLPIGLTGGIIGEFFLPFGLAVTYALIASFIVALTIVPVLAYMFISQKNLKEEHEGRLEVGYHGVIEWALSNRALVLVAATITFVIGIALFATRPTTFLPALGEPQISVNVHMPTGSPLAQTDARARQLEAYLDTKRSNGGGVKRYQTTIGSSGSLASYFMGGGGGPDGSAASVTVAVDATGEALTALTQDIRVQAEAIFGKKNVSVSKASLSEQGFGGFAVVISGPDADLVTFNPKVKDTLATVPGLTNITSSFDQAGTAKSYQRVGLQSAVSYSAELEATDTLGVTRKAITAVKALPDLPASVTVSEGFQSQQQTQGFSSTFSAMGIAVFIVYFVMVVTFGSFIHPFTILFTLPLAVVGAAAGLWITNRVLGISALVGMLMLIGIVVTNAIVMLDRVQQNRKEKKMEPREALIEGARTRLRPILMTALGTMVALLPLAAGFSKGAIIATELGTVVIGGLFSSTVLTLLVVPVVYSMFDGLQRRLFGGGGKK